MYVCITNMGLPECISIFFDIIKLKNPYVTNTYAHLYIPHTSCSNSVVVFVDKDIFFICFFLCFILSSFCCSCKPHKYLLNFKNISELIHIQMYIIWMGRGLFFPCILFILPSANCLDSLLLLLLWLLLLLLLLFLFCIGV